MTHGTDRAPMVRTRLALHQVAEHVLSAARRQATGKSTLIARQGGFATPPLPDGRTLAVEGTDLVVLTATSTRHTPLTTLRSAALLAGVELPAPDNTHSAANRPTTATPLEPDRQLEIDVDGARIIADWFALGDEALRRFSDRQTEDHPTAVMLFPEHFDLAITAGEVNYGLSPGDDDIPVPYIYVGPHRWAMVNHPPGPFWNARFGAYRTMLEIESATAALDFLVEGSTRAHGVLAARPRLPQ